MRSIRSTSTASITTAEIAPTARTTARRRRFTGLAVAVVAGAALCGSALGATPASAEIGTKQACAPTEIHVQSWQKTVTGTCGDDLIFVGNNNNVTVNSLGGDDDIRGGWGDGHVVTVNSGPGNDEISVNPGKRLVADGGTGNDTIVGGNLDDVLVGGDGNDDLTGGNGGNILNGADGDDFLDSRDWGSQAFEADWVIGGLGHDLAQWQVGDVKDASVEGGNANA
jgi:Ca2+-binding RTX toxin-like protein